MKKNYVQIGLVVLWFIAVGLVYSLLVVMILGYPFTGSDLRYVYPAWIIWPVLIGAVIGIPWILIQGARHITVRNFFMATGGLLVSTNAFSLYYINRLDLRPNSSIFLMILVGLVMLALAWFSAKSAVNATT